MRPTAPTDQACLDHTFAKKRASCLVNPRAGYEAELNYEATATPLRVAVVGAGPAVRAARLRVPSDVPPPH